MPAKRIKKYLIVAKSAQYNDVAVFYNTETNLWQYRPEFTQAEHIQDAIGRCENMHKGFMLIENKAASYALKKMNIDINITNSLCINIDDFLAHAHLSNFIVIENPNGDFMQSLTDNPSYYMINI
jgi:hypothetical protein